MDRHYVIWVEFTHESQHIFLSLTKIILENNHFYQIIHTPFELYIVIFIIFYDLIFSDNLA